MTRITEVDGLPKPQRLIKYATHADFEPFIGRQAGGEVPERIGRQVQEALHLYERVLKKAVPDSKPSATTSMWMMLADLNDANEARAAYKSAMGKQLPALSMFQSQCIAPDCPEARVALVPKVHIGKKKRINSIGGWGDPTEPTSRILRSGPHVYLQGNGPFLPRSGVAGGGEIKDQTRLALSNIKTILERMKLSWENVNRMIVLLDDLGNFDDVNEVWENSLDGARPTRAVLNPHQLLEGTGVQIITEASEAKQDNWIRTQQISGAPKVLGDYSSFIGIDGAHFHLAGQLPLDTENALVGTDAEVQMRQVLENIGIVMRGARGDISEQDLVSLTVALTHPEEDRATVENVLADHFKGEGPIAIYTHSKELPKGARVEAIADGFRAPEEE